MQKLVYWLNSYKAQSAASIIINQTLYGEGKVFGQENLTEHFFNHSHNGAYKDMMVQIINFCDLNDQEKQETFGCTNYEHFIQRG